MSFPVHHTGIHTSDWWFSGSWNEWNAFCFFHEDRKNCIIPDDITFIKVLSAYRHAEMLKEGLISFELMQKLYKLQPEVQHYGCMVDVLRRARHVEEAIKLIQKMPI